MRKRLVIAVLGFISGSFSLICFSVLQKLLAGFPLFQPKAYIVPFFFGGAIGTTLLLLLANRRGLYMRMLRAESDAKRNLEAEVRDRTAELMEANRRLELEIAQRAEAESELLRIRDHLEEQVASRTRELSEANLSLRAEILRRTEAEEHLLTERNWLSDLINAIPDSIIFKDSEGRWVLGNDAALELLNLQGLNIAGLDDRDLREEIRAAGRVSPALDTLQDIFRGGEHFLSLEASLPTPENLPRFFHLTRITLLDDRGANGGQVIVARDITQRMRTQEALKRSSLHNELILKSVGEGIYGVDLHGDTTFFNPAAERLTGYKAHDMLGGNQHAILRHSRADGSPYPEEDCPVARCCLLGQSFHVSDEVFWNKQGGQFPVEYTVNPVYEGEAIVGAVVAFQDISQRKRVEAELRRAKERAETANEAKTLFLSNMSHELRTPINAVLGMIRLALRSELSSEQREYLELALQSSTDLLRVIDGLLELSDFEAGRLELRKQTFSLSETLEGLFSHYAIQAARKGLTFSSSVASGIPDPLTGDSGRLRQTLINLLDNALAATQQGGIGVEVRTIRKGEAKRLGRIADANELGLFFAVRDSGPGVPVNKRESIFDSFNPPETPLNAEHGGTGFDLAVCRQIVGNMGGTIWVEDAPGGGGLFCFTVLLEAAPAEERKPARKPVAERERSGDRSRRRLRILLAEDEPVNQLFAGHILKEQGHEVIMAADGESALDILRRRPCDLVLMDIQMPVLSGLEATEQIRSGLDKGIDPELPIIALSAYAMESDRERGLAAGVNDYIAKPFDVNTLLDSIDRVMSPSA